MNFQVPQFIDTEDKIFIYFSFRQFVFIVGGGLASLGFFILLQYKLNLPKEIAFLFVSPFFGLGLALAYLKINGRPFEKTFKAFLSYHMKMKKYTWKKVARKPMTKEEQYVALTSHEIPNHSLEDKRFHVEVNQKKEGGEPSGIYLEI